VTEPYELEVSGPAVRAIREELPEAAAAAIIEFLTGGLRETPVASATHSTTNYRASGAPNAEHSV
jgi:hypothetical protein